MIRKTIGFLLGLASIYAFTVGSVITASAADSHPSPFANTESGLVVGSRGNGVKRISQHPSQSRQSVLMKWASCVRQN
jgi:hypothetical protein